MRWLSARLGLSMTSRRISIKPPPVPSIRAGKGRGTVPSRGVVAPTPAASLHAMLRGGNSPRPARRRNSERPPQGVFGKRSSRIPSKRVSQIPAPLRGRGEPGTPEEGAARQCEVVSFEVPRPQPMAASKPATQAQVTQAPMPIEPRRSFSSTMLGVAAPPAPVSSSLQISPPPAAGTPEMARAAQGSPEEHSAEVPEPVLDGIEISVQLSSAPPALPDLFSEVEVGEAEGGAGAIALTDGSIRARDRAAENHDSTPDGPLSAPTVGISDAIEPLGLPARKPWALRWGLAVAVMGCLALAVIGLRYRTQVVRQAEMLEDAHGIIGRTVADLAEKNEELVRAEMHGAELEEKLVHQQSRAVQLKEELEAAQASVSAESERLLEVEKEAERVALLTERLRPLIDSGAIQVGVREGLMVIEMGGKLIFPSGRAYPTPGGRKLLKQIAKALRVATLRRFVVAGHTDNVRVNNQNFKSNWELAAARSTAAMQVLSRNGMRARQLVVASYAQHDPVASNRTAEGRARNSRLEITMTQGEIEPPKPATSRRARGRRRR